ncbi:MAG TPA: tRNA pseudouridine(55) synthase TruB [candidate division Zixibacteria bacterium]|nr:tRNA pseudouridine(55) synthase TruB [candidate division Zixibacteria bacterium]
MLENGILLIDKPEGPSSAQVVHRVKTLLGARKVGHLGTLDPFASGLLVVGVNEGTKIADVFLSAPKSYRGIMALGVATDSQDATGKVVEVRPVPFFGEPELEDLARRFTGELKQVPPMFSALKKDGMRLYRLARQGKEVPREPRTIRVERLGLKKLSDSEIEFEVTCSRGTYVRTLAADMGTAMGCGAHLKSLRRTACGPLTLDQALKMEVVERLLGKSRSPLLPINSALAHIRAVCWDRRWVTQLRLGQQKILSQLGRPQQGETLVRVVDPQGRLVALVEWSDGPATCGWRLARVFRE